MTALHQVLAVEKGAKGRAERVITDVHHDLLRGPMLEGIARTYEPLNDEGEQLPAEHKRVQVKTREGIDRVIEAYARYIDVVATKDTGNQHARADVTLEGDDEPLLRDVPTTHLLFLEKVLVSFRTFIEKLPILDPTQDWTYDTGNGCWVTPIVETVRTKKVPRNHVRAEATDKHPAQVDVYHEDVVVGTWKRRLLSGALPATHVDELLKRIIALQDAVKVAREKANTVDVDQVHYGKALLDHLFAQ